jgi:hopene-associated glycosyltransferase HpnB
VIESLLTQRYTGDIRVILVDDDSSDDTQYEAIAAARRLGSDRLTVMSATPVPHGWKGKMWALAEGVHAAEEFHPHYYLFADADIVHGLDSVRSLVACAESGGYDLVSQMVKLYCESFAERLLIPAFTFFFFMLYPPRWVSDKRRSTAAAAGGCALIRADALRKIGGIAAIHDDLIDDCALAGAVKRGGGSVWLGQTAETHSIRPYGGFTEINQLISRTAFTQLNHSVLLLLGTVLGLTLTYLVPPLLLFAGGWAALLGGTAWLMMSIAYWPTLRFYGQSPMRAPLLPVVALSYLIATVQSALEYWQGLGGQWKGRVQDPVREPEQP